MEQDTQQLENSPAIQQKEKHSNNNSSGSTAVYLSSGQMGMAIQRIQLGSSNPLQLKRDMALLQRTIGNHAVVQLLSQLQKQHEPSDTATVHNIAAIGVQGTGNKLPHYDKIQASFGRHDISYIQAYTGSTAAAASYAIGAQAYATGTKVAFADNNPSLHTAAHEATHIIQQQAGVSLKGGVGKAGDPYEQQADKIADAVVQGKSVENLLYKSANESSSTEIKNKPSKQSVQRILKVAGNEVDGSLPFLGGIPNEIPKRLTYKHNLKNLSEKFSDQDVSFHIDFLRNDNLTVYNFITATKQGHINSFIKAISLVDEMLRDKITPDNNEQAYINFLEKMTKINGIKIVKKPVSNQMPTINDFRPITHDSGDSSIVDLSEFKTKIENDTAAGFGATTVDGQQLKTEIKWGPVEGCFGTMVNAFLGPDHPLGSTPHDKVADQARKDMELISGNNSTYIAGHLLNEQLGGPGVLQNLAPITSKANAAHKVKVENHVKGAVNNEHKWIFYSVRAARDRILSDSDYNSLPNPSPEKDAIDRCGKEYISSFINSYAYIGKDGQVNKNTEVKITLKFENPLELRKNKLEKDIILDSAGPSNSNDDNIAVTEIASNNVILTTDVKTKAKIIAGKDFADDINKLEGDSKKHLIYIRDTIEHKMSPDKIRPGIIAELNLAKEKLAKVGDTIDKVNSLLDDEIDNFDADTFSEFQLDLQELNEDYEKKREAVYLEIKKDIEEVEDSSVVSFLSNILNSFKAAANLPIAEILTTSMNLNLKFFELTKRVAEIEKIKKLLSGLTESERTKLAAKGDGYSAGLADFAKQVADSDLLDPKLNALIGELLRNDDINYKQLLEIKNQIKD